MPRGLIVDDSKFMRKIITDILLEGGHTVAGEADNGQDGIEMYDSVMPDFVTMDITMGGTDGMDAVKIIKDKHSNAKIVVISALSENTIKLNDQQVIADMFITKPFDKEQLLSAIDQLLKK